MAEKKYITGFPQTQAQMAEWQKKYKFDPTTKKWYEPEVSVVPLTTTTEETNDETKLEETFLVEGTPAGKTTGGVQLYADGKGGVTTGARTSGGGVGGGTTVGETTLGGGTTVGGVADGGTNPYQDYLDWLKGQPSWQDVYKTQSEALGIPGMVTAQTGLQKQVLDVEGLLDKLDDDISARISGKLVSEPQRRRYLATEGAPLREQLADLMRAETRAGTSLTGARGELATMMGLEEAQRGEARTGFETALEAYQYESPEEKFARMLREEEAKKTAGVSPYYTKPEEAEPGVSPVYGRYRDRLEEELQNMYAGMYGKEFSREKIIEILKREFPDQDVSGDVYTRIPDGYEARIEAGTTEPGKPITEAQQLTQAKADMKAQLMLVRGGDGYISPDDYKKASDAWHKAKLSKRKFDEYFEMFVNPSHPEDYGIEY